MGKLLKKETPSHHIIRHKYIRNLRKEAKGNAINTTYSTS